METIEFPHYADINKFGDIICPHCQLQMITPAGMYIKQGQGKCISCGKNFTVSEEKAKLAQERSASKDDS